MGEFRATKRTALATLAATLASACATVGAGAPDQSRLERLAAELAAEVAGVAETDPRARAAALDLVAIAAFADGVVAADSAILRWEWPAPLWEDDGARLDDDDLAAIESLAPMPAAIFAQAAGDAGLVLGRFADARLATAMTGLDAYLAVAGGGVTLVAGPLADEASASERCLALSVWGVSCTPADWPEAARPLGDHSAGSGT
jgi:hypothetical protein